ncbi:MAG: hypothetical protein FWC24_00725 [Treponema sp.]|nr:hypothetical protein [Treponema sp.]
MFIVNPRSFWKKARQNYVVAKIHQFFRDIGNNDYEIYVSRFPRDAVGFIPLFAKNLPESAVLRVYAVGGDGILFDCLNGIMGLANVQLAVIPYGLTNSFIQGFDKNDRPSFKLMSQQYDAPVIPIDILRCGSNYALNYCTVGVETEAVHRAEMARERLKSTHPLIQWFCKNFYPSFYLLGALSAFSDKGLLHQLYDIMIDGEIISGNFEGISVFNGAYYGGSFHPVNNAVPNDGILNMLTVQLRGVLKLIFLYPFYMSGKYTMFPRNFVHKPGNKITIHSDKVLQITMDGIVFYEPELEIELLPGAVQFVDASGHGYKGVRL